MREHCDALELGHELPQQLQALPKEISRAEGQPRDVPPRAAQTRRDAEFDGVVYAHKDDGHRRGHLLGGYGRCSCRSQDDIDLVPHQLLSKPWKLFDAALGHSEFDNYILAVDVSQLVQALLKRLDEVLGRPACA